LALLLGLRLHLVCTLGGLPIAIALTGAKADERETLLDILATEPELVSSRPGQTLIGDKNYFGREFEAQLADMHIELLRPARKGEAERAGSQLFKPLRRSSSQSTKPSKDSSTSNDTTAALPVA
jgi:hypothetical protein